MFSAGHVTCFKFVHISFTAACAALVKVTSFSLAPAQGFEGKVTETLQPAREVTRSDVPSALPYRPNPGLITLQFGAAQAHVVSCDKSHYSASLTARQP